MHDVKMVLDVLETDRTLSDRWYVSNGATSIGPVGLELIVRGIEAGKVPLESFVRNETWKVWRPLRELVVAEPRLQAIVDVPEAAPSAPASSMPASSDIAFAADEHEALLLAMVDAVRDAAAENALVHVQRDGAWAAICAHGGLFEQLGRKLEPTDPVFVAAVAGLVVVAEPVSGAAGATLRARLGGEERDVRGAAMFPVIVNGRLFGMLELGRTTTFLMAELARVEKLVETLVVELSSDELPKK